jgi:hypothetical protein
VLYIQITALLRPYIYASRYLVGTVKGVHQRELEDVNPDIILANTYHCTYVQEWKY